MEKKYNVIVEEGDEVILTIKKWNEQIEKRYTINKKSDAILMIKEQIEEEYKIDFGMYNIKGDKVDEILECLEKNYVNESVNLIIDHNYINDGGFKKIVDVCKKNNIQLSYVDAENNHIRKEGLQYLLESFPNVKVDLQMNFVTYMDLKSITEKIPNGTKIMKHIHI